MIDNPLAGFGGTPESSGGGPVTNFAVVTSVSPLKIRLAGDDDPLEGSPPVSLVSHLKVGQVVRVEFNGRQLIITGRVDGDPTDLSKRVDNPAWRYPTFLNGWGHYTSFGELKYRRIGDKVEFTGTISGGTAIGSTNPMFYVDPDCTPSGQNRLLITRISNTEIRDLRLLSSGAVVSAVSTVPSWMTFEGITYFL